HETPLCGCPPSSPLGGAWGRPIVLTQLLQQVSVQVQGDPVLCGTPCPCQHGLSAPFNSPHHLLACLVVGTREEGTDPRFDRVPRVGILHRTQDPLRPALRLEGLFPPRGWAKQGDELIRDVLEPAAAERAQYLQQIGVFIHRWLPRSGVLLPLRWP